MMRVAVLSWIGLCLLLKDDDGAAGIFIKLGDKVGNLPDIVRSEVMTFATEHIHSVYTILNRFEEKRTGVIGRVIDFARPVPPLFTRVSVQDGTLNDEYRAHCSRTSSPYSQEVSTPEGELPEYTPRNQDVSERSGSGQQINLSSHDDNRSAPTDVTASQEYLECMKHYNFETIAYVSNMWLKRTQSLGIPFEAEEEKKRWTWLFTLAKWSDQITVRALSAECFSTASRKIMHHSKESYPLPGFMSWAGDIDTSLIFLDMKPISILEVFNRRLQESQDGQTSDLLKIMYHQVYTQTINKQMLKYLEAGAARTFLTGGMKSLCLDEDFLSSDTNQQIEPEIQIKALSAATAVKTCISNDMQKAKRVLSDFFRPYDCDRKLHSNNVVKRNLRLAMAADILELIAISFRCFTQATLNQFFPIESTLQ